MKLLFIVSNVRIRGRGKSLTHEHRVFKAINALQSASQVTEFRTAHEVLILNIKYFLILIINIILR